MDPNELTALVHVTTTANFLTIFGHSLPVFSLSILRVMGCYPNEQ